MALGPASYDVVVGRGLLPDLAAHLERACPAARYAVVADDAVAERYGPRVREAVAAFRPCDLVTFPAGEWNKTREHWAALTDRLLGLGLGRDAALLALGGGVTGDLAGFVAATYQRGIPYVQLPTSVLAMIDSSVGGKTGVDTAQGKNLVGAFHQPRLVVADVDTLATLPPLHVAAGLAEALKHGAIADAVYFAGLRERRERLLAADPDALADAVHRSVEIKAAVVAEDEREAGRRAILNFGHTVAHAIEAVTKFEVLHGEAVATGIVLEAEIGRRLGVTEAAAADAVRAAVQAFGLPVAPPEGRAEQIREAMQHDKKRRGGTVRFALIERVGQPYRTEGEAWTVEAPESVLREVLTG